MLKNCGSDEGRSHTGECRLPRRVLVTGGSGFLGTHLHDRLAEAGAEVHTVSRRLRQVSGSTRSWQADLRDHAAALRIVREVAPDVVFHLAGYPVGCRGLEHVLPALSGNLLTTVNILHAATTGSCARVLIAGSLEEPRSSDLEADCFSPYAASRWAATIYARMFHHLYEAPVVVARIGMVYGPGPQDKRKLVPYVVRTLLSGESPKLMSGDREVDWIYVEDVVDALVKCSLEPLIEGRTIEIGTGSATSIRGVVERLTILVGGKASPSYGAIPDRCFEANWKADVATTEAQIGWRSRVCLDEGLARTVEWFRRDG